jgi:hypothetical protein
VLSLTLKVGETRAGLFVFQRQFGVFYSNTAKLVVESSVAFQDVPVASHDLLVLALNGPGQLLLVLPPHFRKLVAQVVQQELVLLFLVRCCLAGFLSFLD